MGLDRGQSCQLLCALHVLKGTGSHTNDFGVVVRRCGAYTDLAPIVIYLAALNRNGFD